MLTSLIYWGGAGRREGRAGAKEGEAELPQGTAAQLGHRPPSGKPTIWQGAEGRLT